MGLTKTAIALIGDFSAEVLAHQAINKCFVLAQQAGLALEPVWTGTDTLVPGQEDSLRRFGGFWCVPASPYRSTEGALWAIQFARTHHIPFLGTCGGYQHALLEYARNVLGLKDADHTETNPAAALPLVSRLRCSLVEKAQKVLITSPSFAAIYGADSGWEGYRCNYGLNPEFEQLFSGSALEITARSEAGQARAVALRGHPFFVGVHFQPERAALGGSLHPLVRSFFEACCARPQAEGFQV